MIEEMVEVWRTRGGTGKAAGAKEGIEKKAARTNIRTQGVKMSI